MNTPNPKCSCCHIYFVPEIKSSGLAYKTCSKCRVKVKNQNKCPHNKKKQNCVECSPCPHNKIKSNCVECNPCPHNKIKSNCVECSPCPHNKIKSSCVECSPCPHNKRKSNCVECNPCPHNKRKSECRKCCDALKLTIQRFIGSSKMTDKNKNMFDIVNFIDADFCHLLIQDSNNKCCYCECDLDLINYGSNLITIERINNSIGHIKSNVKIACYKCNISKIGSKKV